MRKDGRQATYPTATDDESPVLQGRRHVRVRQGHDETRSFGGWRKVSLVVWLSCLLSYLFCSERSRGIGRFAHPWPMLMSTIPDHQIRQPHRAFQATRDE